MSYIQKSLLTGEQVVYAATLHWIVYVQGLGFTIAGGLLGFYAPAITGTLLPSMASQLTRPLAMVAMGVVLIGIFLLLGAYVKVVSTELAVTNQRVIAKYGFMSRTTFEIMLNRVTGANFDQTITGRILGFGTIIVRGAGSDISPIDNIANPQLFHNYLMQVLEKSRAEKSDGD